MRNVALTFTISVMLTLLASSVYSQVSAGSDTLICEGASVTLNATGGTVYTWQTLPSLSFTTGPNPVARPRLTTAYIVTGVNALTGNTESDTVIVFVNKASGSLDTIPFCETKPFRILKSPFPDGYSSLWSTGDQGPELKVVKIGTYILEAQPAKDSCLVRFVFDVVKDPCLVDIHIPDAFSPDNDGVNDFFTIYGSDIAEFSFSVFNRLGEKVFESKEFTDQPWDGTFKGANQPMDYYTWILTAKDRFDSQTQQTGTVLLIR